ncbi:Nek1 [Symbiodinium sp. KB8]|nr:Nek1 [Symbiodinium sp. KB8]
MASQSDFEFGQQLGRGSFGVVFKVRRKGDGLTCVCKQIQLSNCKQRARDEANKEVNLLRRVSHGCNYIVQYLGSFLEGEALHILMEYCERGDLCQFLKTRDESLEERAIWKYLLQIGLGLRWLHQNRILHRDIKTMNVFLKTNDDVRLGDLGVARVLSNTSFAHTFVGTPYYLSPEICEERPYNELSDVWAFGCVVYEMCTLRHPFEARNQAALLIKILRGQFAPIQASYSQDLRELIDGCLQRELHKRTRLADIFARAAVQSWAAHLAISLEAWSGPVRVQTQRRPPQPRAGSTVSAKATQARSAKGIPRTRVRLDPRAGAGRREEGSKQTLVAPKTRASDRTHVAKGIQDDGKPKLPRCDGEKARLKAEVAELPDVVVATARTSRNVPSVQQLLKMDDSPVKRLLQRNGGRLTQAALQEDAESIEEVTIRPEDTVRQAQAGSDEIREELEAPDSDWDGDAEVTHQSVFEDSLLYTGTSLCDDGDGSPTSRFELEWSAEEEPFALTATLDDGLLCDACDRRFLEPSRKQEEDVEEEGPTTSNPSPVVEELEPTIVEDQPVSASGSRRLSERAGRAEAELARLTSQINRLYSDVARDLDAGARAVWDELYALFQDKMGVEMTDQDQSEIEAFIFEHLPTESTDLIWRVYKVLHLEQERDRWQRAVATKEAATLPELIKKSYKDKQRICFCFLTVDGTHASGQHVSKEQIPQLHKRKVSGRGSCSRRQPAERCQRIRSTCECYLSAAFPQESESQWFPQ